MNDKVAKALSHIDEKYIAEAGKRKKRRSYLKAAIAAILVIALVYTAPVVPLNIPAEAVSEASDSRKTERPNINSDKFDAWYEEHKARNVVVENAIEPIADFTAKCSEHVLSGDGKTNQLWSPINAYIALAMTAELTGGDTRETVLDVLGVSDLSTLRENISAVWENIYKNNGKEISVIANSLWLDNEMSYEQDVMDVLAYHYYASVYRGELGSARTNKAITNWLNNQTGGLLKDRSGAVELKGNAALAAASTVYFQAQWGDKFDGGKNTNGVFHSSSGDVDCTFMNAKEYETYYYWADDYGAVRLGLANGASMWFILPDEDKTVEDVLSSNDYAEMVTGEHEFSDENSKWMKVNLSVPKFDISVSANIADGLKQLGMSEIFEPFGNDFSPSIKSDLPIYLDSINQDSRVSIDEDGVVAASYILLEFGAGAAMPPDEVIDFVLDRPFVFAITSDSVPLFVGALNTL